MDQERLRPMATDIIDELDKDLLKAAVVALKAWHGFQSRFNTNELYNSASKLFKANFDPVEYDSVE